MLGVQGPDAFSSPLVDTEGLLENDYEGWDPPHLQKIPREGEKETGPKKKYACPHCEYSTEWLGSLNYHLAYHTGKRLYYCTECDYRTPSVFHYKDHFFARHSGHKPYKCNFCDYRSVTVSNLKRHVMTKHTNEKPHSCPHCDYAAVQMRHLKAHIQSKHTPKGNPINCPHCSYKTNHAGHMKRHLARVHEAKPKLKTCSKCDYTTQYTTALKKHVINKHDGHKPWKCPGCPHRSAVRADIKRHISFKHPELLEEGIEELEVPETGEEESPGEFGMGEESSEVSETEEENINESED